MLTARARVPTSAAHEVDPKTSDAHAHDHKHLQRAWGTLAAHEHSHVHAKDLVADAELNDTRMPGPREASVGAS
jgi:hypothetical protein